MINNIILPELSINPKKPVSIQTACRWLLKLGWQHTLIKKGVYMDGHEHADVIEYRMNTFLPVMTKFEAHMVHFNGPDLEWTVPTLKPDEKEIVALYHDELCFQANDATQSTW